MIKYYKCIKSYTNNEIGTIYSENDKPEWFKNYSSVKHFIEKSPIWNMYFEITECKLPEKWAVKVTPENVNVISRWRTKGRCNSDGYCLYEGYENVKGYWISSLPFGVTEISFEQFKKYVLKESIEEGITDLFKYIGRYIKALVDNPNGGNVKAGDIGLITDGNTVDFPNHKDYYCSTALYYPDKYELMPEDYKPESSKKEKTSLNGFSIGDWCYVTDKETSNLENGKVYKINQINPINNHQKHHFDNGSGLKDNRCWLSTDGFRKATEDEIPKDVFSEKSEFKVGDWVYHTNNKQTYKITEINRGLFKAEFGHCCNTGSLDLRFCRKATKEEIAKVTQQIPVFMSYKEYPEYPLTPNECFKPKEKGDEWRYITGCDPSFEKPKQKEKLKLKRFNVKKI